MKKLNIYIVGLAAAVGFTFTACDDDDTTVAKAVMASVPSVTFEGLSAQPQVIQVVSDADWYSETPENITVTPATGHGGTTDVTITITDNLRDGTLDNPHEYEIYFRGDIKKSIATVKVYQNGDKYRGIPDYEIWELATAPDGVAVVVPGMTIAKVYGSSAVATDGTEMLYVYGKPEGMADGAQGTVKGTKKVDENGDAYVECDEFQSTGSTTYNPGTPEDITSTFGSFTSKTIKYISLHGYVVGGKIMVEGQSGSMVAVDVAEGVDMASVENRYADIKGYYLGKVDGTHRILVNELTDAGKYQTVFWSDDFEWLEPWTSQKPAGQTVETNNPGATAQQLGTNKVDGVSTYQALMNKGYEFLAVHDASKGERPANEQIYLQRNYLKMGLTGYQSGITLPSITTIPDGSKVMIMFDWCSQRQGTGTWDATDLVVVVKNGDAETQFAVPEHRWPKDEKYYWVNAKVDLSSVKVDKNSKISVRNADNQWPTASAMRWFIDNIKIVEVE